MKEIKWKKIKWNEAKWNAEKWRDVKRSEVQNFRAEEGRIFAMSLFIFWFLRHYHYYAFSSSLLWEGAEWFKRQEGQPGTFLGWQGIVPTKVKKMGGKYVSDKWDEANWLTAVCDVCCITMFDKNCARYDWCSQDMCVWVEFHLIFHAVNKSVPHLIRSSTQFYSPQLLITHTHNAGDIADTLLNDLLDLKKVFARINTNKLTPLIVPSLCREINAIIKKEGNWWNIDDFSSFYSQAQFLSVECITVLLVQRDCTLDTTISKQFPLDWNYTNASSHHRFALWFQT